MYPYGIATHQVVILSALWMHPQILLGVRKLSPPSFRARVLDWSPREAARASEGAVREPRAKIFPSDLSCLRTFVEFQVLTLELGCPGDCLDDA